MQLSNSSRHKRVPRVGNNNIPQKKSPFRFVVLLAILGGIGYLIFSSPFFKVADIKITGLDQVYASEVYNSISNNLKSKSIFGIKEGYVSNLINEQFPNLKLNEMKYNFPNKFEANVSQREEKYQIQAANGTFSADEEGYIVGQTEIQEASSSMDIIYDKSVEVGKRIEDVSFQAALVYSQLNQNIKIQNGQIQLTLNNGAKVILPENDAVLKAEETYLLLQKIIQKYSIDNRQIEFIDLRFEKPVIKYY